MCSRFKTPEKPEDLIRRYGGEPTAAAPAVLETFPGRTARVVRREAGTRRLTAMAWGFPPPANRRTPVTNVRNLESPFWRDILARPECRCLVPVTAFCEWQATAGKKLPRWFSVPSLAVFSFAGIWRPTPAGRVYAFLTCAPNALVAPIHPKAMPVILRPGDEDRWLCGGPDDLPALAVPFPPEMMAVE